MRKPWNEQTPEMLPLSFDRNAELEPRSWSPDGQRLAFTAARPAGLYSYDFKTKQVQRLLGFPGSALWLKDSRRLLVAFRGLQVLDSMSLKTRAVSSAPHMSWFSLSGDDRLIAYRVATQQADIWLASPMTDTAKRR